jgi:mannan endo-1,4-beta-mannosidase
MPQELSLKRDSVIQAAFAVEKAGVYALKLVYRATERTVMGVTLDGECLSVAELAPEKRERELVRMPLAAGAHALRLERRQGDGEIERVLMEAAEPERPLAPRTALSNPEASENARRLMSYLGRVYGKKVLTGQHTKDHPMREIAYLEEITGKAPAVCGFELLGYSPNVQWETSDEETVEEARNNQGTIERALDWAERRHGIVAYCWHWFSPMGGNNKAFYTEHTDFDAERAVTPGTEEYEATLRDIDCISEHLKVFAQRDIPILWRPLHEAEGGWFWWGSKGAAPCKKLWRILYERMTKVHGLNNLIWVWNSLDSAWYPGDDCVDIVAADLYATPGNYGSLKCDFDRARALGEAKKMVALSECGANPDPERAVKAGAPWLWFMTWCGGFVMDGNWNSVQQYRRMYRSPYAITLEDLKG